MGQNEEMKDCSYWKVAGEAISDYGSIILFENRLTILSKNHPSDRPKSMNGLVERVYVDNVLDLMPNKCGKCGFQRFFGLKIAVTSIGQYITVFCPNCKLEFGMVDADSGKIERYTELHKKK